MLRMLVVLLVASCSVGAAIDCAFPAALTGRSRWESRISNEHRSVDRFFKFRESHMEIVEYQVDDIVASKYECVRSIPTKNAFILRMRSVDTSSGFSYKCVQFIVRSESVVEMKESLTAASVSDTLCKEGNLKWNPWPLVWPQTRRAQPSLITGGYDMEIMDDRGKSLCKHMTPQPRLESNCMVDEGLVLYFRHFDCRGKLSMELQQRLDNLGSWRDGEYSYSILTDSNIMWPKLWMLRAPAKLTGDQFVARLYTDIIIDRDDSSPSTSTFYTLSLTKTLFTSLCQDETKDCSSCIDGNSFYCQRSCGLCQATKTCQFPESAQGEWTANGGAATLRISGSSLKIDGLPELRCLQLKTIDDWYRNAGFQAVAAVFDNGCRPRYSCVDLRRRSASVLQYRLAKNLIWPHRVTLLASDICIPRDFLHERGLAEPPTKTLLRATKNNTVHAAADCGIDGKIPLSGYYASDNCTGALNSCLSPGMISLQLDRHGQGTVTKFRCIASYRQGTSRILIAENFRAPNELVCWIFRRNRWTGQRTAYLMPSANCSDKLANNIDMGLVSRYIGAFQLGVSTACSAMSSHHTVNGYVASSIVDTGASNRSTIGAFTDESPLSTNSHGIVQQQFTSISPTSNKQDATSPITLTENPTTTTTSTTSKKLHDSKLMTDPTMSSNTATATSVSGRSTDDKVTPNRRSSPIVAIADDTQHVRHDETTTPTTGARAVIDDVSNVTRHAGNETSKGASNSTKIPATSTSATLKSTSNTVTPPRGLSTNTTVASGFVTRNIPPSGETNDTYSLELHAGQRGLTGSLLLFVVGVYISFIA